MLFGVYGEVRSKKDLTGPALLEMSGYGVNRDLADNASRSGSDSGLEVIVF
jgi:hypothetical protein